MYSNFLHFNYHVSISTPRHLHFNAILASLHWPPVKFGIHFKIILLTAKAQHGQASAYIAELLAPYNSNQPLRSAAQGLLTALLLNCWNCVLKSSLSAVCLRQPKHKHFWWGSFFKMILILGCFKFYIFEKRITFLSSVDTFRCWAMLVCCWPVRLGGWHKSSQCSDWCAGKLASVWTVNRWLLRCSPGRRHGPLLAEN